MYGIAIAYVLGFASAFLFFSFGGDNAYRNLANKQDYLIEKQRQLIDKQRELIQMLKRDDRYYI